MIEGTVKFQGKLVVDANSAIGMNIHKAFLNHEPISVSIGTFDSQKVYLHKCTTDAVNQVVTSSYELSMDDLDCFKPPAGE